MHEVHPDGADINRSGAISINLEGDAAFTDWNTQGDSVYFTYRTVDPGTPARDLYVDRKGFSYFCSDDNGGFLPKFNISGSTGLTVDLLGVEVNVSASTVGQGQPITATAAPINFQGTSVVWVYDTAQFKPQIAIPTCANASTCSYTPPRSGHLVACITDSFSGFYPICGLSPEVTVRAVSIRVDCPTVQRGGTVTCVASAQPIGASLVVTEWKFKSAQLTDSIIENAGAVSWQGKAALSGTVTVKGTIDGILAAGSGALSVTKRTWGVGTADTVGYFQKELAQNEDQLPDRPRFDNDLGSHQPGISGALSPLNELIATGPNQTLRFLTKVPITASSEIGINRIALAANSEFYFLQYDKRKARGGGLLPWCARSDVPAGLPYVIAHEGLGSPLPLDSHARVFHDEVNRTIPPALESIVVRGPIDSLKTKVQQVAIPLFFAADSLQRDSRDGGIVPPSSWPDKCVLQYFPA